MNRGIHMHIRGKEIATSPPRRAGRRHAGFTLIELMVVVAVIAILASIAYPSYQEQIRKSRRAQAKADLVELTQVLERFRTVNNTYAGADGSNAFFDQSPRDNSQHYTLTLGNDADIDSFTLTATPTSTSQLKDRCGNLTINQAGVKGNSKGNYTDCW